MELPELLLKIKVLPIGKVKPNPDNPRQIGKRRFDKLKKSITDAPWMLYFRPVVIDKEGIALGGNMRLRASIELGLDKIPTIDAADLTEEQKREFIIKDNVEFGEMDIDTLTSLYNVEELQAWGLELINQDDVDEMDNPMNGQTEYPFSPELDMESNYVVLKFTTDIDWLQAKTLFDMDKVFNKKENGGKWNMGLARVIDGAEFLKKVADES